MGSTRWANNMSYILDALKKSEQERATSADSTQPVNRIFSAQNAVPERSLPVKEITLVLALLIPIVFFFYMNQNKVEVEEDAVSNLGETSNKNAMAKLVGSNMSKSLSTDAALAAPIAIELAPNQWASQLSPINITSHIFSSQPARRSIVSNGIRLKEGDSIEPNVWVHQITHQGMIIRIQNALFIINRSRGWSK